MKYIFIINPIAGNDDKKKIFSRIKSTFRLIDDEMIIEQTHCKGEAKDIASSYSEKYGKDCVIVSCGGDGTVHEIANGLAGSDTPMLILPLGTGNDFAKKIYGTKKINVENVIKAFGFYNGKIKYKVKPIDLIDYNGEKCINIMSFGLDVMVETIGRKIAGKIPFLGSQAYNLAIFPVLCRPLRYTINLDLDCIDENGQPYKITKSPIDFAMLAICNASYYGGGFCPAPDSKLDDGILDFAMCQPLKLHEAPSLIVNYSKGNVKEIKKAITSYLTGGKVWVSDGVKMLGECDGENFDYDVVDFKVEHNALNLCFLD
ncbi:MAG: hypothetical protein LUG95_04330 [Clostridiales bacterium]|nr:hypothetical protein [Clostridiales bacterium]